MKEDLKATSLPWQQVAFAWNNYFTVPSRISAHEEEKYREWLGRINTERKPLKGLVLGATPELRDALADFGYSVFSIDINVDMFLAMDELLKSKDANEVIVRSNWLNNPLAENYFDVVLGDAVLPNVPWNDRQALLTEVKRLLKPDGIFLTRSFCAPAEKRFSDVQGILDHFSLKEQPVKQSALEMVLELQFLTYDPEDHLGSFAKAKDVLAEYHAKNGDTFEDRKLQEIHDLVWDFWCQKFVGKVFVYARREEEDADYRKYFTMAEIFETDDHDYSKITPMYFLKKK